MLLPLRPGGGPTEEAKTYRVLRAAVGVGGSAPDDSGIDGLWRWARARALAAATSAYRRAIYSAFPNLATDLIPYYERALGLPSDETAAEQDRREAVRGLWPMRASSVIRDVAAQLQQIDTRFSIVVADDAKSSTTHDGRWFGHLPGVTAEPPFGLAYHSSYAAETSRYVMLVLFDVGYLAGLSAPDARKRAEAEKMLCTVLPPWWDFRIVTSIGFLAGVSPIGLTGWEDAA
jgi:hypothetical protein